MKQQKKKKALSVLMMGLCLTGLTAGCGSDDDNDNGAQQQQQDDQGFYRANLTALNSNVAGNSSGTAEFAVQGDEVVAIVNMDGTPMRITHVQHIHTGDTCPTQAADTNNDGVIDVVEGVPAYGPILVPLDGDIESQAAGGDSNPKADSDGSYSYRETGSLSEMLSDLRAEDENTEDALAKLESGEELNLEGRHVVVHGVPADTELPDSAASVFDLPAHATLPIACGAIERVPSLQQTVEDVTDEAQDAAEDVVEDVTDGDDQSDE